MITVRRAAAAIALVSAAYAATGCAHSDPRFYAYGAGSIYDNAPHPASGWFGERWYPGHGTRVYDRDGRAYVWSKAERAHWGVPDRHGHPHARSAIDSGGWNHAGGTDRSTGQPG